MGQREPRLYTLGIDPGVTTGWAVLDHHGTIWDCGQWTLEEVLDGIDWVIRGVNRTGEDLEIVQEVLAKGRDGALANDLRYAQVALTRIVEDTYDVSRTFVLPGTWKNSRHVQPVEDWNGKKVSAHTYDAVNMARWRMANRSPDYKPRARFLDMPSRSVR